MSTRRRPRIFHGGDHYAAFALGSAHQIGSSFADSDVFVAARGVSESVIPGLDEDVLEVEGENAEEVEAIRSVLLGRSSSRDLWSQHTLPMELHSYINQLIYDGELFVHLGFDRSSPSQPYSLFSAAWLAPETIEARTRRRVEGSYEQFVSIRAFEGMHYVVTDGPKEHLAKFAASEILHLRWPFGGLGRHGSPARAARKLGEEVARQAERTLLASRAAAEPQETFLPIARARSGAYTGALERQQIASAKIKDMLLYPGAYEAVVFPWIDKASDYFAAERILRSRIAICQLRSYLLDAINEQLLQRWTDMNDWGQVKLILGCDVFSEADWQTMRAELDDGKLSLEDVRAAVAAEGETRR